jgi:Flp pilus assembly protein TadB
MSPDRRPRDLGSLRARRLQARVHRRMFRIDVAAGVAIAVIVLLAGVGLAIAALVAIAIALICGVWFACARVREGFGRRGRRSG